MQLFFRAQAVSCFLMVGIFRRTVLGFTVRGFAARNHGVVDSNRFGIYATRLQSSSYEVDADEESEQLLADRTVKGKPINGIKSDHRYSSVLDAVGIDPSLLKQLPNIADKQVVSQNDVFCNRELNMGAVRAVGFDMDYTLAQYKQPAFDKLAFDGSVQKLVHKLGYPKEMLDFEYDHTLWTRGLIIDTQRGNFLKIDRHKYVRVAYHGLDPISSTTRKYLYSRAFNKVVSFSEKHFINMDTLFQFVDAHLFASLIDLKDKGECEFLDCKTYAEIYADIRECVDLCHRDGVIKDEVARNPEKYIIVDPEMLPMLQRYKDAGVKVFLLTNSYWEYTSQAMNYLYHGKHVDEETKKKNEWLDVFDLAVVGSCKPLYMTDPYLNLFRLQPEDGSLLNTDGLFEIESFGPGGAAKFLEKGKTFQGGNWKHLQAMLETEAGEEILYVGDHLYSDVLRSKRTLGWRSAFIMPELEEEMKVFHENAPLLTSISRLRELRGELGIFGDSIRQQGDEGEAAKQQLKEIEQDDAVIKEKLTDLAAQWHGAFHPIWGAIFNAGYQDSRFAFYVENYACLYTSKATNLGLSSTSRSFRTTGEMLPHDKLLIDPSKEFKECDPWNQDRI